jgi:S1-C subfamily serine protease
VIYTLNGESVASVAALRRLLDAQPRVAIVALQVERAGELRFIAVELLAPVP